MALAEERGTQWTEWKDIILVSQHHILEPVSKEKCWRRFFFFFFPLTFLCSVGYILMEKDGRWKSLREKRLIWSPGLVWFMYARCLQDWGKKSCFVILSSQGTAAVGWHTYFCISTITSILSHTGAGAIPCCAGTRFGYCRLRLQVLLQGIFRYFQWWKCFRRRDLVKLY